MSFQAKLRSGAGESRVPSGFWERRLIIQRSGAAPR